MHSGNTGDHKHVLLLQLSHALLPCFAQLLYTGFIPVAPPILWILFHLFEADLLTTKDTLSLSAAAGNPLTYSFRSPYLRFSSDARRVVKTFYSCAFSADPCGFLTGRRFGRWQAIIASRLLWWKLWLKLCFVLFFWWAQRWQALTHRPPGALRRHVGTHFK